MHTGSVTTARIDPEIQRDLVELSLIEEYKWTPDYIASLPYKWIQKHKLIKKIRNSATDTKRQIERFKSQAHLAPGTKTWREI